MMCLKYHKNTFFFIEWKFKVILSSFPEYHCTYYVIRTKKKQTESFNIDPLCHVILSTKEVLFFFTHELMIYLTFKLIYFSRKNYFFLNLLF